MSNNDVPPSEHRPLNMRLDALRATAPEADIAIFDNAVNAFRDLHTFFDKVTLMTWGCYFHMHNNDTDDTVTHVFAVIINFIPLPSTTPACPKCSKATAFKPNKNVPFGWEFWCVSFQLLSRQQARHLHVSSRWLCTGAMPATHNTWFKKRAIHFPVRGTHILLAEQPGCEEGVHDS